ncbi:MAG TPA: type VI secretion system tube protein Hcp [Pyrinomonadaceae bacterium]|nr:type VI secretion system tube protein Hcp [Pyrinomonadaceae bacterium]
MQKVFLKLDGIKGESPIARHRGEIEVASFYWGGNQPSFSNGAGHGRAVMNNITVIKQADKTSPVLRVASKSGRSFQGLLTLEDYSAQGNLVRSIIFELQSVYVDTVTRLENGEVIALSCRRIKLLGSTKGKIEGEKAGDRNKEKEIEVKTMKRNLVITAILLAAFALFVVNVTAQFTIKIPKIKIDKPEKEQSKNKDANTTENVVTNTNNAKTKTSDSKLIYAPQMPTNVPVFMKNSLYVQAKTTDEYWKMPGQSNYSSWVPVIRFNQYYNEEKVLNYAVEYFNPDGSAWYSEKLESSGRNADRTVLYQSLRQSDSNALATKSTAGTGVYSFKITDQDTKAVLFQGKFKVGKASRAFSAQEKNKNMFYVEQDWLAPLGEIGFHFSLDNVGGMPPLVSVWLNGLVEASELEGRIFYNGKQIATTRENGGVSDYDERIADYAAPVAPATIWKRWQFQWNDVLFDNNGSFNRDNFPNAHYVDKNPGEYTVKIYRSNAQIRELSFTVGTDGRIVAPAYSNQIPLPYYRLILPVKAIGNTEKFNTAAWKTDAFYGNPLNGFMVQ